MCWFYWLFLTWFFPIGHEVALSPVFLMMSLDFLIPIGCGSLLTFQRCIFKQQWCGIQKVWFSKQLKVFHCFLCLYCSNSLILQEICRRESVVWNTLIWMFSLPKALNYQCSKLLDFLEFLLKCRAKLPLLPFNFNFFKNFNSEMVRPVSSKLSQNMYIWYFSGLK